MIREMLHNYSPAAGVLGVKRVLGYGKRFIVAYVTWTCPEPKSAGCHLGTLEKKNVQPRTVCKKVLAKFLT